MSSPLSYPPISTPLLNGNLVNPIWSKWFQLLYNQAGGASNPNLTGLQSAIVTLQSDFAVLTTEVTTLQTQMTSVTNIANALSVGRQL